MSASHPWNTGNLCRVTRACKEYDGKVLAWEFGAQGNFRWIKLEYAVTYQDWQGQMQTRTLLWPRPIPSYKLRKGIARMSKEVNA